jgi:uncharacterized protein YuzE
MGWRRLTKRSQISRRWLVDPLSVAGRTGRPDWRIAQGWLNFVSAVLARIRQGAVKNKDSHWNKQRNGRERKSEVDVLSIVLSDAAVEESDEDKPDLILDYDALGNVVSLEILQASKRMGNPLSVEYAVSR